MIGVKRPDPALASHDFNDYVFERRVERKRPDGTTEGGRIDLYKRGCFILEAKQSRLRGGKKAVPEGQADLFVMAEGARFAFPSRQSQSKMDADPLPNGILDAWTENREASGTRLKTDGRL